MSLVAGCSSFAVGPARIMPAFLRYTQDAYRTGILSINHRSDAYAKLWTRFVSVLHEKLDIPANYTVVCCSSATACWDIVARSFTHTGSYHICQGTFAEKWEKTAASLQKSVGKYVFPYHTACPIEELPIPVHADVLACTQNETSNGTQLCATALRRLSARCKEVKDRLFVVDATSSLGAVALPWADIDICFSSVQKALALPAGMALLIASPRAVARAKSLQYSCHYDSYLNLLQHFSKQQAPYTPNVLNIYLLMRSMADRPDVYKLAEQTRKRAKQWYSFLENHGYDLLIKAPGLRSNTVITIQGTPTYMRRFFSDLQRVGLLLSPGYTPWQATTLRIANFPAIRPKEIAALRQYLVACTRR